MPYQTINESSPYFNLKVQFLRRHKNTLTIPQIEDIFILEKGQTGPHRFSYIYASSLGGPYKKHLTSQTENLTIIWLIAPFVCPKTA